MYLDGTALFVVGALAIYFLYRIGKDVKYLDKRIDELQDRVVELESDKEGKESDDDDMF